METWLKKIDLQTNERRFYRLRLPAGSRELLTVRGRIGEHGTEKWDVYETHEAAQKAFVAIEATKRKRGYTDATEAVMPSCYRFYRGNKRAESAGDGQLSLFED